MKPGLNCFTETRGCAVVGASSNPKKAGYQIVQNMIETGYPGFLAPVNPAGGEILGKRVFARVSDIDKPINLVVLSTPAPATPEVLEDLRERMSTRGDIRAIACTAAGYSDAHNSEGAAYEAMLKDFCSEFGIRMLGPNCVGLIDNHAKIDTTFIADISHIPGGISFVSQSGAVGAWLMMSWTATPGRGVGFHQFMTVGNMADVDIIEALEFTGKDPETTVMGLYIEGSPDARSLVETAGAIAKEKPVIVLKVGKTDEGAQAAASHTGSLAGTDALYDAAFEQYGLIRAATIDELSDSLRAFDAFGLPEGNNVFILTQAGGPGIICVDAMASSGLFSPAMVSDTTKKNLKETLPPFASVCKPEGHADITAAATAEQHVDALETVLRDPGVDAVVFITTATLFLDLEGMSRGMVEMKKRLEAEGIDKPIMPVIISGNYVLPSRRILEEGGIPTYESPERAVRALANMIEYKKVSRGGCHHENS